ncbi:MAG TPA: YafY family protein [Treponemataceae bacterium]|nr:YafY family protein [Treponemataceae bacterium]
MTTAWQHIILIKDYHEAGFLLKIDRLISIIMILLEKKRIGAKELADLFEVSKRTIYRDIDTICMAGIPVVSTPGSLGGFEIMSGYKVTNKIFSTSDLCTILTGLTSLSNLIRGDELVNALAKVKSFIPSASAKDIAVKTNQICIDLSPWTFNRNIQPYVEYIQTALSENRLLSFDYADRRGSKTSRQAEPSMLVLKNSQWYFQGYCRTKNDYRLFKLVRMSNLHMQDEVFIPRDHEKPQLDYSDAAEAMQTKIKIRIHASVMDRLLDYCSFDSFIPDGEEHYIVLFPFIENDYYYSILMSFGGKCECLEPLHIRTEMKRRIQRIADVYEG